MAKIAFEIKSCKECPFLLRTPYPTQDSFERPEYWHCDKKRDVLDEPTKIGGYIEWNDKVDVPDWCPIKLETK